MPDNSPKPARKTASPSNAKKNRRNAPVAGLAAAMHASSAIAAAKREAERQAIVATLVKSTQKAATTFEHFSLSKFAKEKVPANYVDPKRAHDVKAVQDAQRKSIHAQLKRLPHAKTRNAGVTITFPTAKLDEMKKAVPGLSEKGGEVKVDALLAFLGARMNARSFYSAGHPALQRLTAAAQARERAKEIIANIKKGASAGRRAFSRPASGIKRSSRVDLPRTKGESKS